MSPEQKAFMISEYISAALLRLDLAWHECPTISGSHHILSAIEGLNKALVYSQELEK